MSAWRGGASSSTDATTAAHAGEATCSPRLSEQPATPAALEAMQCRQASPVPDRCSRQTVRWVAVQMRSRASTTAAHRSASARSYSVAISERDVASWRMFAIRSLSRGLPSVTRSAEALSASSKSLGTAPVAPCKRAGAVAAPAAAPRESRPCAQPISRGTAHCGPAVVLLADRLPKVRCPRCRDSSPLNI